MTIAYCVMNNGSGCTTPAEFDGNELAFVRDLTLGGVAMPKDENYSERGEAGRCDSVLLLLRATSLLTSTF